MNNFMDKWFGPLPREYCVYFYALSIVFGIMWVVSLVAIITFVMLHFKKISLTFIINSCMMALAQVNPTELAHIHVLLARVAATAGGAGRPAG